MNNIGHRTTPWRHLPLLQLWPLRIPINGLTRQDTCNRGKHFELLNPYFIFSSLDSLRPQTVLRGMNNCKMDTFFVRQCGILSHGLGSAYWIFSLLCNLLVCLRHFFFCSCWFFPLIPVSWTRVYLGQNPSYKSIRLIRVILQFSFKKDENKIVLMDFFSKISTNLLFFLIQTPS